MEPQRGIGGGEEFTCGLKSANRFLENTKLGKTPFTTDDVGAWVDARKITEALNAKVNNVALPILCKEPVLPTEHFIVGTKQDIARGASIMTGTFPEKEFEHLSEITQFIMLKGGHYTVFEKNNEGEWQEWDDKKEIKKFPDFMDALDAIAHAFGQMQFGDSGAIIYQGKQQE